MASRSRSGCSPGVSCGDSRRAREPSTEAQRRYASVKSFIACRMLYHGRVARGSCTPRAMLIVPATGHRSAQKAKKMESGAHYQDGSRDRPNAVTSAWGITSLRNVIRCTWSKSLAQGVVVVIFHGSLTTHDIQEAFATFCGLPSGTESPNSRISARQIKNLAIPTATPD